MKRRTFISSLAATAFSRLPLVQPGAGWSHAVFPSNGNTVRMDWLVPNGRGPKPAVILLHGRGGISHFGKDFEQRAKALADRGFMVGVLHYFDATRTPESPEVTPGAFEIWRQALSDGLQASYAAPGIDKKRIALIGVSLGGFLGAAQAAQDVRVAALVSESSGISKFFPKQPGRMPPVLSVHAKDDPQVPLDEARKLNAVAERLGAKAELLVIDTDSHLLAGADAQKAQQAEIEFLTRVLPA